MSISTILGLIFAITIIIVAMSMGPGLSIFINIPGLLIVIGGTTAATMIRYSAVEMFASVGMAVAVIKPPKDIQDPQEIIDLTEEMIRLSRQNGLLSLESFEIKHEFYANGVRMLVDGYPREIVLHSLREENKLLNERAETSAGVLSAIADTAPAFGMLGTLVGLIQMLSDLSDPETIGPAMAVAMLTTLYGVMLAQLLAAPLADKITSWLKIESMRQLLIIDAIDSLSQGHNIAIMHDLLCPYLSGKKAEESEDG